MEHTQKKANKASYNNSSQMIQKRKLNRMKNWEFLELALEIPGMPVLSPDLLSVWLTMHPSIHPSIHFSQAPASLCVLLRQGALKPSYWSLSPDSITCVWVALGEFTYSLYLSFSIYKMGIITFS